MFDKYIERLESIGWNLLSSNEDGFIYQKRSWLCELDGPTNTITFFKCRHKLTEIGLTLGGVFCKICGKRI